MRISQNSSAFGDVRCVIAHAANIENCRVRAIASTHVGGCCAQIMKLMLRRAR
jgi:hypothetical protein